MITGLEQQGTIGDASAASAPVREHLSGRSGDPHHRNLSGGRIWVGHQSMLLAGLVTGCRRPHQALQELGFQTDRLKPEPCRVDRRLVDLIIAEQPNVQPIAFSLIQPHG